MGFGIPAQHGIQFSIAGGPSVEARSAVLASLHVLGWSIRQETDQMIIASATMSAMSWGEKITVQFLPNGSISVCSACAFPLQLVDWGKNRQNVERLLEAIKVQMSSAQ